MTNKNITVDILPALRETEHYYRDFDCIEKRKENITIEILTALRKDIMLEI